jgi:hypothetical protein
MDKEEIRVVDTHGSLHLPLFHRARAAGVDVERSFAYMPCVFSPRYELQRMISIGKEPTREFLTQCFVDQILRNALALTAQSEGSTGDTDVVQYLRRRSAVFTETDAREILDTIHQENETPIVIPRLNEMLQEKGFGPLPMSKEALDADIAQYKKDQIRKKEEVKRRDEERRRQER